MGSSRVLRLGVGFKPRTPPPSRPPRSPSSLNRLSEAKRAKPGKPGVFPPTGRDSLHITYLHTTHHYLFRDILLIDTIGTLLLHGGLLTSVRGPWARGV